jgi:hypothetical protein
MDRIVNRSAVPAAQGPAVWLLSTHDGHGRLVLPDVELVLTEDAVRAFGRHVAALHMGLEVSTYERPDGLSSLTVDAPNGSVLNLSRERDAEQLLRAALRADLSNALAGPAGADVEPLESPADVARERDEARTEVRELRAALAAANAREVFLNLTIGELRAAPAALTAPAPALALTA